MLRNDVSGKIVDAALRVHTQLGPGLLESTYEKCLEYELLERGLEVKRQVELPVEYAGVRLEGSYWVDLVVEDSVIVELKTVQEIHPIHKAQLLSYLRLSGKELGLLLNFNVVHLKEGIVRVVNSKPPF